MKHSLTITIISGLVLAGCAPDASAPAGTAANSTAVKKPAPSQFSTDMNNAYSDASDEAASVAAMAKASAVEAADHAENLNSASNEGFYQGVDHVADWMRPSKPKPPQPIAATYCYHVYQDILCYRQPMPGWESRVAGYQPLGAPPPGAAIMQPLPKHMPDPSQLPANRVASSKPVFSQMPTPPAPVEKAPEDGATMPPAPDATHEQLPDPAMAPQL